MVSGGLTAGKGCFVVSTHGTIGMWDQDRLGNDRYSYAAGGSRLDGGQPEGTGMTASTSEDQG